MIDLAVEQMPLLLVSYKTGGYTHQLELYNILYILTIHFLKKLILRSQINFHTLLDVLQILLSVILVELFVTNLIQSYQGFLLFFRFFSLSILLEIILLIALDLNYYLY